MSRTAYLDETKRKHYMLCAVVVAQSDLSGVRKELSRLKGRYDTIHMNDRSHRERLAYSEALGALEVEGMVVSTDVTGDRAARNLLLEHIAPTLLTMGVTQLVIESCQQDREDRQALQRVVGRDPTMSYFHAGKSELMLALPDILGWAYGRGGAYREAVKPIATDLGRIREA